LKLTPTLKTSLIVSVVVSIVAAAAYVYWPKSSKAESRFVTEKVERGPLTQSVAANGTLNPVILVNVGSQVSGIVKTINADFNDQVKAGQILLELDPALFRAQMQQSSANVESARATLELAQVNESRMRGLYAQEFASKQELDAAVQALKAAKAQLALSEAQALRDRTNLAYTIIRSPVSGTVVSRQIDVGQTVAASFTAPVLFQIANDLSKMQINSNFAEADIGNIKPEQTANFSVDAFPGQQFKGKVRQVRLNPTTLQNVVTYNVVIDVDNPGNKLLPGMTAYVSVITAQKQEVLKVPNGALRFRPSKDLLTKKDGEQRERKPPPPGTLRGSVVVVLGTEMKQVSVLLGASDGKFTEVVEGDLKENDATVVEDRQSGSSTSNRPAPPIRL
jgi:HlyD family secretion protein